MGGKYWWAIFWATFLFTPLVVSAGVIINEVKISGSGEGQANNEFIELYNSEINSIDIGDWKLYKFTRMSTSTNPTSTDKILIKQLAPETEILGQKYFLIAHNNFLFTTSTDIPDSSYGEGSLAADNTILLCRENDEVVDLVGYGDATAYEGQGPAPDPKTKSIVRNNFIDTNENFSDLVFSDLPTPQNSHYGEVSSEGVTTTTSSTLTSTTTPTGEIVSSTFDYGLKINEVLPDIDTGEEWVEIYNPNTSSVQLSGWKVFDGVGERASPTGTVPGFGFFVIDFTNVFNNSGDIVILKNERGESVDQVSYGGWPGGSANADLPGVGNTLARKIDGEDTDVDGVDFLATILKTKGTANVISAPIVIAPPASAGSSGSSGGSYASVHDTQNVKYSEDVKINELVSDPSDGQTEFVEMKNSGVNAVDLTGWYLKDGGGARTEIMGIIYADGFVVVDSPRGNLNNSGDQVFLYSPDNVIKDSVAYGDWKSTNISNNALRPDDPFALARKMGGVDSGIDKNDWEVTYTLTRGFENIFTTKKILIEESATSTFVTTSSEKGVISVAKFCSVDPSGWDLLRISEFLPNPKGDESGEFIEIENTSSSTVDLCGLYFDDEDGGSRLYEISTSTRLLPHELKIFNREETKLALNNDADEVRLLSASGTILCAVNYEKSKEGKSYSLGGDGDWYWTEPSPQLPNKVTEADYVIADKVAKVVAGTKVKKGGQGLVRDLAALAESAKGDYVDVFGVVSVPPAVFGAQYFFIFSTSTGIGAEVYMNKKNFPVLRIGDVVRVRGVVSESYGRKRINTKIMSDITRVGGGVELGFEETSLDSFGVLENGALVAVSGEVTEIKASFIYIDDGTDEVKIYFKKGTGMSVKPYALGDHLRIKGLLISTAKELQIQPREKGDVTIEKIEVAGEKIEGVSLDSKNKFDYGHAILLAVVIIFGVGWLKNSGIEWAKKFITIKR